MARTRTRTRQEQLHRGQEERAGAARLPSLDRILLSYADLPQNTITTDHLRHFAATREVLWNAIDRYSEDIEDVLSQPRLSRYRLDEVNAGLHRVVDRAREIPFPDRALAPISYEFIDVSLSPEKELRHEVRKAIGDMGVAVGGEAIWSAKVDRIGKHYLGAIDLRTMSPRDDRHVETIELAKTLLDDQLGADFDIERVPSVASEIARYAKENSKKAMLTGAAALITTNLLPTAAHAAGNPDENEPIAASATILNEPVPLVKGAVAMRGGGFVSVGIPQDVGTPPAESSVDMGIARPPVQQAASIQPKVGLPAEKVENVGPISMTGQAEASVAPPVQAHFGVPEAPEVTEEAPAVEAGPVSFSAPAAPVSEVVETSVSVGINLEAEASPETTFFVTPPAADAPTNINLPLDSSHIAVERALDTDGNPMSTEPIMMGPQVDVSIPQFDTEKATPEQLAVKSIHESIKLDGDVDSAASLIRLYFHDINQPATQFKNGEPVYETTNPALVKSIISLEVSFDDLIAKKGHADPAYVNNTLMALAVANAAANDQSVLNSPEVQQLISGVTKPADEYMGKLFDRYLAKAKEALAADGGVLIAGIHDKHKPQFETMYAYLLMANVSDEQQASEIKTIKDEEAAEAARQAASLNGITDIEVIAADPNLLTAAAIDRAAAAHGWPEAQRILMREFALAGSGLAGAAGAAGNAAVESDYFNPGVEERTTRADKGFGLFQWTFGRRGNLESAARDQGVSVTDAAFQAHFAINESKNREQRDNSYNEWEGLRQQTDPGAAADYWRWNFERPDEHVSGADRRVTFAVEFFNQASGQINAIQAEAAEAKAAREAAAKAEAERKASRGMNYDEAVAFMEAYKNSPDSVNHLGGAGRDCAGGPLSNCVSFSAWYINTQSGLTTFDATDGSENPGNGSQVVGRIQERNPEVATGSVPQPGAIWSYGALDEFGHTGVVLGVFPEQDLVITGEAFCSGDLSRDGVRTHSLADWSSGWVRYAYLRGH